jgi:hypothetical protein
VIRLFAVNNQQRDASLTVVDTGRRSMTGRTDFRKIVYWHAALERRPSRGRASTICRLQLRQIALLPPVGSRECEPWLAQKGNRPTSGTKLWIGGSNPPRRTRSVANKKVSNGGTRRESRSGNRFRAQHRARDGAELGGEGAHVVVNVRSNQAEADAVVREAQALGVKARAVVADVAPGRADFPHPVLHERDSLAAT